MGKCWFAYHLNSVQYGNISMRGSQREFDFFPKCRCLWRIVVNLHLARAQRFFAVPKSDTDWCLWHFLAPLFACTDADIDCCQ